MPTRYTAPTAGLAGLLFGTALLLAGTTAHAQGDNLGNHSATQHLGLNDFDLRLRSTADGNHGLGWYGTAAGTKSWLGQDVDGPVLYGYTGGVLGINRAGARSSVLTWNYLGNVGIGLTSPLYPLHVVGASYLAGPLTATGNLSAGGTLTTAGPLGVGTTAPALQLHLSNGNTPAIRMEQTTTSGYPAQTWDIGANEANFFVRDLTGGSRLSFRIRPGAPTSAIDIAANGNVGIGTATPQARLDVQGNVKILGANTLEFGSGVAGKQAEAGTIGYGNLTANALNIVGAGTSATNRQVVVYSEGGMTIKGNLTLTGPVVSTSDARLKLDVRPLTGALPAVLALQGHRYRFRPGAGPAGEQVGLLAQELEKTYPELVITNAEGFKAVNYAQLTPVLIEAIKEQQRQLDALRAELAQAREQQRQLAAATAAAPALEQRLRALEQALNGRDSSLAAPAARPAAATTETPDGRRR